MTDIEEFAEYLRSRLPPLQDLKVTAEMVPTFEVRAICTTPSGKPYSFAVTLPLDTPRDQVTIELDGMVGAVKDAADSGFEWGGEVASRIRNPVPCDKHAGLAEEALARIEATVAACPDCVGGAHSG